MYEAIPKELKGLKQWVLWREVERDGRPTKEPFQVTGAHASTTRPETWKSFDDLMLYFEVYDQEPTDKAGIGFVFTEHDPYCGIDLDGCIVADKLNADAAAIVGAFSTYAEFSPSKTGLHLIFKGRLPSGAGRKRAGIELYDQGRFFTMTGHLMTDYHPDQPLPDRQAQLDQFYGDVFDTPVPVPDTAPAPSPPTESQKLERYQDVDIRINPDAQPPAGKFARLLENPNFEKTWKHRRSDLSPDSPSEYDMSLARFAYNASWTPQEICDLLVCHRKSSDFGKTERLDYYQRTLFKLNLDDKTTDVLNHADTLNPADHSDRDAILDTIKYLTNLDLERYVQYGESPASYGIFLKGGTFVRIQRSSDARNQEIWRDIAQERIGLAFMKLPAKKWQQFLHCLSLIREYEAVAEASDAATLMETLQRYQQNAEKERTALALDELRPFIEDGHLFFSKADFIQYLNITKSSLSQQGLIALMRGCGVQNRQVWARRDNGTLAQKKYWCCPLQD